MKNNNSEHAFTLIELMIVVAIIGILAAIAIPQFANLVAKSQEGATKGNLGTIRSSLSIYYGDLEGWYPTDNLASLIVSSKYLQSIPKANLPHTSFSLGHTTTNLVTTSNAAYAAQDGGGWFYDNQQGGTNWGQNVVSCTHSDSKGNVWTSY